MFTDTRFMVVEHGAIAASEVRKKAEQPASQPNKLIFDSGQVWEGLGRDLDWA